jgi:uncharacterized protein (DUF58 family)
MDSSPMALNCAETVTGPESPRAPPAGAAGASAGFLLRFRRIYILPTRQGMGFAGAVSVMLLGAINYGNALGYVLSFMLVGTSLVSMLHAVRNLAGLRVANDDHEPVFAGDMARFVLRVDNRGQRQRFGLLARLAAGQRRGRESDPVVHFGLAADGVKRIELQAIASRRGWYSPGRVVIATRFPFGLFRAWSRIEIGLRCLVYPRPDGEQAPPEHQPEDFSEQGARGKGEDEFSGLRDYQQGDSARRVHWKAVARGQGVPVKIFSGGAAGVTVLRWQDVTGGDTEARLSQLCRWILDCHAQGLRFGLCLPGVDIPADGGEMHRSRCLAALALYENAPDR